MNIDLDFNLTELTLKDEATYDPWTLEDGACFIRRWEEHAVKHGVHLGLTGSVLYKGFSKKDLDVIVYPHQTNKEYSFQKFRDALSPPDFWIDATEYHEDDEKEVWSLRLEGQRIDFFFLK